MHDTHHSKPPAPKTPRRTSFTCSTRTCAVQHYQQNTMKQSQILTPPLTPPRSPRSSMSTPTRNIAHTDRSMPKVHFDLPIQHNDPTMPKVHFDLHMPTHHSDLTTSSASLADSTLWTLPGSSCFDSETSAATPSSPAKTENRWSRLLQKAASSNRDRHRARLEGDGWAFVGGRYSDELQELIGESAASVDDEFDVVVLPREGVGC